MMEILCASIEIYKVVLMLPILHFIATQSMYLTKFIHIIKHLLITDFPFDTKNYANKFIFLKLKVSNLETELN